MPTRSGWCTPQNTSSTINKSGSHTTAPQRQQVDGQATSQADDDERRVDRQQQLLAHAA